VSEVYRTFLQTLKLNDGIVPILLPNPFKFGNYQSIYIIVIVVIVCIHSL
jgi:hypothetical protein